MFGGEQDTAVGRLQPGFGPQERQLDCGVSRKGNACHLELAQEQEDFVQPVMACGYEHIRKRQGIDAEVVVDLPLEQCLCGSVVLVHPTAPGLPTAPAALSAPPPPSSTVTGVTEPGQQQGEQPQAVPPTLGDPSTPAVSVTGLVKTYGSVEAVRGIDLEVRSGETFGFLGPNGAGKSTTIGMLCTLVTPTAGHAEVAGFDVIRERDRVRRHIGLVFQDPTLDTYLSAERNLRLHAELYGVPRGDVEPRMQQVLQMVGLWERRKSKVSTFSGGMRRRLEIARGLLHSPRVLFLDEPTIGLDPQTRSSIWSYIGELKRTEDITIFMTTHYMDEAEFCDRIAIMDNGQVIALDTPEALKASVGRDRVQIRTGDDAAAIAALQHQFGITAAVAEGVVTFSVEAGESFVPRLFAEFPVPIQSVSVSRPTLDDVFMSYTGATIRDAEVGAASQNREMISRFTGRR